MTNFNVIQYIQTNTNNNQCDIKYDKEFYEYLIYIDEGYEPTIDELNALQRINTVRWSKANISKIPKSIRFLTNITYLNLSDNIISDIPYGIINNLTKLKTLNLRNNKLKALKSGSFTGLNKLIHLDIKENQIKEIESASLSSLTGLKHLNLRKNKIQRINDGTFIGLKSLLALDLYENNIQHITENAFCDLLNINNLNLGGNNGIQIDIARLQNNKSLTELNLNSNRTIIDIAKIKKLSKLERLDLNGNDIINFHCVSDLLNLTRLCLGNTGLKEINADFSKLKRLHYLDLSGLEISTIPNALRKLANDNKLDFKFYNEDSDGIYIGGTNIPDEIINENYLDNNLKLSENKMGMFEKMNVQNLYVYKYIGGDDNSRTQSGDNNIMADGNVIQNLYNKTQTVTNVQNELDKIIELIDKKGGSITNKDINEAAKKIIDIIGGDIDDDMSNQTNNVLAEPDSEKKQSKFKDLLNWAKEQVTDPEKAKKWIGVAAAVGSVIAKAVGG